MENKVNAKFINHWIIDEKKFEEIKKKYKTFAEREGKVFIVTKMDIQDINYKESLVDEDWIENAVIILFYPLIELYQDQEYKEKYVVYTIITPPEDR